MPEIQLFFLCDTFLTKIRGSVGSPSKAIRFCNLRALRYPKIDAKTSKIIMPIYTVQVPHKCTKLLHIRKIISKLGFESCTRLNLRVFAIAHVCIVLQTLLECLDLVHLLGSLLHKLKHKSSDNALKSGFMGICIIVDHIASSSEGRGSPKEPSPLPDTPLFHRLA